MAITVCQLILSLLSGFGGALILYSVTVRESKKACRKAIIKELEFAIHKAITTVSEQKKPFVTVLPPWQCDRSSNSNVASEAVSSTIAPSLIIFSLPENF